MAAILDVWIAKPGDACLVDDDEWLVTVDDPHGVIFQWAGTTYAHRRRLMHTGPAPFPLAVMSYTR